MDARFKDKTARVIVVESSGSSRTLITEVLRTQGFQEINGVSSLKDALGIMEAEPVDWIITSLFSDQPVNGLHLLNLAVSVSSIKNLKISFLLDESEEYVLKDSFRLGLMSTHSKPYTKESLSEEFSQLFSFFESSEYNSSLVSAEYLRRFLKQKESFEDCLSLEKNLLELYPNRFDLLENTLPLLAKLDQKPEIKSTLKKIKLLYPDDQKKFDSLKEEFLPDEDLSDKDGANYLEIENVVIVDNDESIHKLMKETFTELGVPGIHCFSDGDSALTHLKDNNNPELIIQEWRIPKITGPLFIQKSLNGPAKESTFIVMSSLIKPEDIPLVKEMGVCTVVTKPIDKADFIKNIVWTIQQQKSPKNNAAIERKFRQSIRLKKKEEAKRLLDEFLNLDNVEEGPKMALEAEYALLTGQYDTAKDLGINAIKHMGNSIFVLNLLGKTLVHLGEYEVALKCYEKAQDMSPMNIERLCQIAEVHSVMGNEEKAQENMDKAKEIASGEDQKVKESETKIAVNENNVEVAKELMGQLDSMENVVAFLNNQAVTMSRCQQVEKGIEQYHKTLESIPDDRDDMKSVVNYNLGLAYARNSDFDKAIEVLRLVTSKKKAKVVSKSKSLIKRIEGAKKSGNQLALKSEPSAAPAAPASEETATESMKSEEVIATFEAKKGEMCCYMIFNPKEIDSKATDLLKNPPRFAHRKSIEREASGGADKAAHRGAS